MENLTELEEFIKDESKKKEFFDYVKKQGFETPDDIQGLKAKNTDLITNQKKLKEQMEDLQKKLDDIDLDEYYELKDKSKGSKGDDDLTKLQRELKQLTTKFEDNEKKLSTVQDKYNKTLKINALNAAFDEYKIDPNFRDVLKDAFLGKATTETDGDSERVLIDDGDGLGLDVNEYFKKWVDTDKGKTYLAKPDNKGAGGQDLSGSGTAKTMTRSEFQQRSPEEQMSLSKEGIVLTN